MLHLGCFMIASTFLKWYQIKAPKFQKLFGQIELNQGAIFFKGVLKSCHNVTFFNFLLPSFYYHVKTQLWMIMMESKIVIA